MSKDLLNMLGLMRKANSIDVGETNTGAATRGGKTRLLLLAADSSDNARSRAEGFAHGRDVVMIRLPFTKEELSAHLGKGGCSMAAITDIGFANAFIRKLSEQYPGTYDAARDQVAEKHVNIQRRKAEAKAHERNKKIGKRRTNI